MAEPSSKRRKVKEHQGAQGPTITDPRFSNIQSDPRYRLPSKRHTHVKLDKRFSRILQDDDFTRRAKVDRYGRPLKTDAERNRLKRRYEFEDAEEGEEEEDNDGNLEDEADDDAEVQNELRRVQGKPIDPLRDGALSGSSSSEEESSSGEDEDEELEIEDDGLAGAQDGAVPMGEVSPRIALVNLDWDNIRAEDLFAVFTSFLPAGGRLMKVSIYPSDFGKERMDREEMEGPPKEVFNSSNAKTLDSETEDDAEDDEDGDDDIKASILKPDQGEEFDSANLRRYQLERLRYFYAVLTFSSSNVAKSVYESVDGTEYLASANFFDLRFVPDETEFSDDVPREECEKIPGNYKPNEFVTDALQHSKVKLTWDAEDGSRKEAQARAFRGGRKEIDENDLKAYLGTDSSDSEDDEEEQPATINGAASGGSLSKKEKERQRMRALLGLSAEPVKKSKKQDGPVGDLQITFSSGLSGSGEKRASVFENEPTIEETTVEKYVRKEKERKQRRKERLNNGKVETAAAEDENVDASDILPEPKADEEDLGFDDPFFAATDNVKASASKIRKEERLKKKAEREAEEAASAAQRAELELLMVDDEKSEVRHFDMNEIERAEKRAKKKGKKGKKDKKQPEAVGERGQDAFKMDTQDPRFARLYESHEFAIDPTNPKYRDTSGMKALLDEGRKRRKHERSDNADAKTQRQASKPAAKGHDSDVKRLIEKVKSKKKL